jgi:hypothetical protein
LHANSTCVLTNINIEMIGRDATRFKA